MKKIFSFVLAVALTTSLWATTYTPQPGENTIKAVVDGGLQDGDVIELANGSYTEWSTLTFTTKVTIKAAENAQVSLGIYDLKIQNDFEINGINIHNISTDNYLFHLNAAVAGTVAFKNCTMAVSTEEITTPTPYIFVETTGQGTMIIDRCTFSGNTKSQGAVVYAGSNTITNFTMTNSTVYGCPTQSVYCSGVTNALVDQCTFYNNAGQILYIKGTLTSCVVKNCIFATATAISDNCIKTYGGTVDNCIYYNLSGPREEGVVTTTACQKIDPLFVDAANANFQLKANSPAINFGTSSQTIGDPRWGVAAKDHKIEVEPGTGKIAAAVAAAEAGDTLILKTGTYTEDNTITIDKQITILAAEGAEPKMYIAKIQPNAEFEINGIDVSLKGGDYLFRTTTGGDFSVVFRNCVLHDCKTIFYYLSSNQTINSLIIDNCIFKDNPGISYDACVIYGKGTITNFEMRNSTVMNCVGGYPVRVYSASNIVVDHCTFCNVGKQALRLAETTRLNTTIAVSNCVVANKNVTSDYAYYIYNGSVSNCVYYNTGSYRSDDATATNLVNADPQWIDTANFNLNFPITSPLFLAATDGKHIGDPRWTVTSIGEGIDLPAVLNKANVTTTHPDMTYYENDYFDFGPDGSKDYSARWAGWIVNIAKGKYKVTAEAVAPSGYQLQVEIINPTTGEVVCTKVAPYGKDSIGVMDLNSLAVGQYFVRFKNITTWSQVKVRNLTFTQKGGLPVDMPATLVGDEDHAMLSEYAVIKNDSILFADDDHEWLVDDGWAKWNIKVAAKATYSFTANTCVPIGVVGNGWQYKLTILNGIDTVYSKATKAIWSNGDVANDMGSVVLEPGTYTLMMQNIMENSKGRLLSVDVDMEYLPLTISEEATDNTVLTENLNGTFAVTLTRSLTAGMFNTLCLPFALSAEQIAASDLAGARIIELTSTSLEDQKLYLNYTEVDAIEAGKGYMIEPAAAVVNPVFEGVTITKTAATEETIDAVKVIPTFIVSSIPASPANLYLYLDNTLYYAGQETEIKGMRLYYNVTSGTLAPARMRIGKNTPTALDEVEQVMVVDGKFMQQGQLFIIKNGVVYNAQGQIVK